MHDGRGLVQLFDIVINMEAKHEPRVVQVNRYLNSSHPMHNHG